jgi:PAS domain-containing protein
MPTRTAPPSSGTPGFEESLEFETLLSNLAARFLDIPPEEMDGAIDTSLAEVGAFLGSERGGIGLFSEDGRSLRFAHGYFAPGAPKDHFEADLAEVLPWYAGEVREGRSIVWRSAEDIPPEATAERAVVAALGLKSTCDAPGRAARCSAAGVDHYAVHCSWLRAALRLEVLASIYANALYRRRARVLQRKADDLNRSVLESVPSEIVVLDRAGRIVAVNQAWTRSARRAAASAERMAASEYLVVAQEAQDAGLLDAREALRRPTVMSGEAREAGRATRTGQRTARPDTTS